MSDLDFTAILTKEFRWPKPGDRAFTRSPRWEENAYLHSVDQGRLVLMTEGYKRGADLMVAGAVAAPADRAMLVFPVVFAYRQFLELSLKYLIAEYGPFVSVEPNWDSHILADLWNRFMAVLKGWGIAEPDGADEVVRRIVLEFQKADRDSFSFRYPVDKAGEEIVLPHEEVDLSAMADAMEAVAGYFSGCDGYLADLRAAQPW